MNRITRIKVTEMNHHLMCILCGGYLVDATTIIECLHSFCRTCILKYLETSKYCPICDVQVHKTRPYLNIRSDKTLQALVYKLVPGLFQSEMKRRRDFYADLPDTASTSSNDGEDRGEVPDLPPLLTEDEQISLCLQHFEKLPPYRQKKRIKGQPTDTGSDTRYLLCPAAVTIRVLKKFVRMKFDLGENFKIELFHSNEPLEDEYTLMDIAHIYSWRMRDPLKLFYFVYDKKDLPEDDLSVLPVADTIPHLSLPSPMGHPTCQPSPSEGQSEQRVRKKPGRKPGRKKKVLDAQNGLDKERVEKHDDAHKAEAADTQKEEEKLTEKVDTKQKDTPKENVDNVQKPTEKDGEKAETAHKDSVKTSDRQDSDRKTAQQDNIKKVVAQDVAKDTVIESVKDSGKESGKVSSKEAPSDESEKSEKGDSAKENVQFEFGRSAVLENVKKSNQQVSVKKPVQPDPTKKNPESVKSANGQVKKPSQPEFTILGKKSAAPNCVRKGIIEKNSPECVPDKVVVQQGSLKIGESAGGTTTTGKYNEAYMKVSGDNGVIQLNKTREIGKEAGGKLSKEKTDKNVIINKYDKVAIPTAPKTVAVSQPPKLPHLPYPQPTVTVPFGSVKSNNVIFPSDLYSRKPISQTYSRTTCSYVNTNGHPTPNGNVVKIHENGSKPKKQKDYAGLRLSEVEKRDVNNQLLPPGLQNAIRTKRPYNKKEEGDRKRARPVRKPKTEGDKGEKRRPGRPRRAETVRSLLEKKAQQQRQQQPEQQPAKNDNSPKKELVKTTPSVPVVSKAIVIPKVPPVAEKPKVTSANLVKATTLTKDSVHKPLHPKPVITNAVIEETPSTRVIIQNGIVHSTPPNNVKLHVPKPTPVNITPKNKPVSVKSTPQTVPLAANPPGKIPSVEIAQQSDTRDIAREVTPPKSWSNGDASSVSSPGSISSAGSPRSPASPDSGLSVRIGGTPSPSQRSPGSSSNSSSNGQRGRANKRESIDQIADILARKKAKFTTKGSNNPSCGPIVNGDTPTGPKSVSHSSNNNLISSHSANTPQVTKRTSPSTPQTINVPNGDYGTPANGNARVAGDSPLSSSPEDPADNIPLSLVAKGYDQPLELTTKKKPNGDIKREPVPLKIPHLVKI